ncbi:hypothetical protein ASPZODRAFT_16167 [Penicilliopsis zonata CBS 506.65]|uniref:Uncharacterized protein n=1 Tax=Penicilliopsis zonata CBS 506.65 TaxID=1073090 RepID=A0A1L9SGU2_9EURO|nr:hypothetical protein ASPZODRAFT_16167 [Penicilliopsis zonata CBS 506.65]OJJ46399.1 hypothetical protein ASPZODRAFT_16167 [Penicilliopsis zonata CBS 506.65]
MSSAIVSWDSAVRSSRVPYILATDFSSCQRRSFWRYARYDHDRLMQEHERAMRRFSRHHQHHLHKLRRKALSDQHWRGSPWWSWASTCSRSTPYTVGSKQNKDFWNEEVERTRRRFEKMKQAIEADPYTALFGGGFERLRPLERPQGSWSAFCRSFLGLDDTGSVKSEKAAKIPKDESLSSRKSSSDVTSMITSETAKSDANSYAFDPVSGRMVRKVDMAPEIFGDGGSKKIPIERLKSTTGTNTARSICNDAPPTEDHKDVISEGETALGEAGVKFESHAEGNQKVIELDDTMNQPNVSPARQKSDMHFQQFKMDTDKQQVLQDDLCHLAEKDNLDSLTASDIRALYSSRKIEPQSEDKGPDTVLGDGHNPSPDPENVFHVNEPEVHQTSSTADETVPSESPNLVSPVTEMAFDPLEVVDLPARPSLEEPLTPTIYRILAYDSSTLRVTTAETTSSLYTPSEHLHPTEVLSRLNNAAKFLPHFAGMQRDGFEIVSGGGDILVFQKVKEAVVQENGGDRVSEVPALESSRRRVDEKAEKSPRIISKRQETSFTGSPASTWENSKDHHYDTTKPRSTIRNALRRMVLTGTATAATCYAIGVVIEYFRTGGSDGYGIDGFTEFESERRHRE